MIVPEMNPTHNGDMRLRSYIFSSSKVELKKDFLSRKSYEVEIVVNPLDYSVVDYRCECPDHQIRKRACKHLHEFGVYLIPGGIKLIWQEE